MTKTKVFSLGMAGVAIIGAGIALFVPNTISAQQADEDTSFIQQLAERLGISESEVETAVTEIREERRAERQAEVQARIDEAVENGDLSQDEADLIAALQEVKGSVDFEKPELPENFDELTDEERQALKDEFKADAQEAVLEALADAGYDVSAGELEDLRETMKELGLGRGQGGEKGPRGGFGGPRRG